MRAKQSGIDTLLFSNIRQLAWDKCSVVAERDSKYKCFILTNDKLITKEFNSYEDVKTFDSIYVSPGKYFSMGSASDAYSVLP